MNEISQVLVPDIGDFKEVPIIEVMVKPGDTVKVEDPLIVLESDKASMEVPSPSAGVVRTVLVKIGSLPHSFPDGDPVLKQFFVSIVVKDAQGKSLGEQTKHFGLPYDKILRGPIPDPFIKGGNTRRVPFSQAVPPGSSPATVEVVLTYALIPEPEPGLKEQYLASLPDDKVRQTAQKIIDEYVQPRVLTYRVKAL